jgi:hypothetical protein
MMANSTRLHVTGIDALRVIWTLATGIGTILMLVLLREAWLDRWAIRQVRRPGTDVLRLQTEGEVWDQAVLTLTLLSLFLTAVASYIGLGTALGIPLLVVCASGLVTLGVMKVRRRRRVFRQLRLNRKTKT